jgi:integrase
MAYATWRENLSPRGSIKPKTLGAVFDLHIAKMKAEGKYYWKQTRTFYDRALEFFGDVDPLTISPTMAISFKIHLDRTFKSPAYVDRHVAMVKAAWRTALWSVPNPFREVKMNNPDNGIIERLTVQEEIRLLKAAEEDMSRGPPNLRTIIVIGMNTGFRIEQVLNLHTREIDYENRLLHVTQKGGRQHTVPMNETLYQALRTMIPPDGGYLFPNKNNGGLPFIRFDKTWKKLKAKAKIDPNFRFHGLRHNFATTALKATGNLAIVRDLLGHASIKTTEKYAHVLMEDLREAVRKIG